MQQWQLKKESGFTLIEMIAALIILGIMAIALSSAIMYGVQNLVFARDADQLSQKAQLALARINKELIEIRSVSSAGNNSIQYISAVDGGTYNISLANNSITLSEISPVNLSGTLIDGLGNTGANFLTYINTNGSNWSVESSNTINQLAQIRVVIVLGFQQNQPLTFQTTVNPRKNTILNAPRLN